MVKAPGDDPVPPSGRKRFHLGPVSPIPSTKSQKKAATVKTIPFRSLYSEPLDPFSSSSESEESNARPT